MLKKNERSINIVQRLIDSLVIIFSWFVAYYLRFNFIPNAETGLFKEFLLTGLLQVCISYFVFQKYEVYTSYRMASRFNEILNVVKANFISFFILVISLYFLKSDKVSRIHLSIFLIVSSIALIFSKVIIRKILKSIRRKGYNLRHILLIGSGSQAKDYIKTVKQFNDSGISFMGWIDPIKEYENYQIPIIKEPYANYIESNSPDNVIISYSNKDSDKLNSFLKENYNSLIPIQVLPDLSFSLVGHKVEDYFGIPLLSLNEPQVSIFEKYIKLIFDFIASLIALTILSPLLFIISLGVKISSPGPIFYGQERIGLNGKRFKMWKFRSMRLASKNEDSTTWSSKDDPRKTKFGNFIRSTSIDELPQLWNVLVGDMSLIGPRPERPFFVDKFKSEIPNYMLRHKMKAGITGWAQVNGWRGDTDLTKRIECDIYYIKNWSLFLDIKIVFLTIIKGFINKNAY
tara:strand:+ start:119780 stop:121156 length:1377 start_codon:yes stop_codon:yes gene_type:complete